MSGLDDSISDSLSPERRRAILDGAGRIFARDGYEGASMAQIAREVGVSKGTLYNYFPGKAALFSSFVADGCDERVKPIFETPSEVEAPEEILRRLGMVIMEMLLSPFRQAIHRMVVSEAGKFPELARAFFEAGPQRALSYLSQWLAQEDARGRLVVPDPAFAAEQFFALCQTKIVMRARLRLIETADPAEIDRVVEGAISLFLNSYAPPARMRAPSEETGP
jgi:TetR/AcrR family transcriptional regulator, mexJK operon transcriptional repressor